VNAPRLGARDLGIATACAFVSAAALYVALALSAADALLLLWSLALRGRWRAFAVALAIGLSPVIFIAIEDLAGRAPR
jgi:hypothetical protein